MSTLVMKLFVSGRSIRSDAAITNLELAISEYGIVDYELVVIDVQDDPQAAEDEFILATPTLIKVSPEPVRRIIGDLSNQPLVIRGLDLTPVKRS